MQDVLTIGEAARRGAASRHPRCVSMKNKA